MAFHFTALALRSHEQEETAETSDTEFMNAERPEESLAREIVELALEVTLQHADTNGDVDYRFETVDGKRGALEVTTVTDSKNKIARDQWAKESPSFGPAPSLRQCWQVWIEDRDVRYKGLLGRLEPALAILEDAGRGFDSSHLHEFMASPRPERDAAQSLLQEKVTQAFPYAELCRAEQHEAPHRIEVVRQFGFSASGSDAALEMIEIDLNATFDNFGKLRGADEKQLFVWVDEDTDLAVARPFRGGAVSKWQHFGLPSRPPNLREPVERLWIIDRATLAGWVWTPSDNWTPYIRPTD